jgi:hypothetical protein
MSEEFITSYPEDGDSRFLQNVGHDLPEYLVSCTRRQKLYFTGNGMRGIDEHMYQQGTEKLVP